MKTNENRLRSVIRSIILESMDDHLSQLPDLSPEDHANLPSLQKAMDQIADLQERVTKLEVLLKAK